MYGPARFFAELRDLGFVVDEVSAADGSSFAILDPFSVPCGRFLDRVIGLGLQATPDFPRTVSSAIHVKAAPQLFECTDTQPGVRNITQSILGPDWRYWSHNFGWDQEKNARRLISQINGIFANA